MVLASTVCTVNGTAGTEPVHWTVHGESECTGPALAQYRQVFNIVPQDGARVAFCSATYGMQFYRQI